MGRAITERSWELIYINQGLQFIGGYNKADSNRELKFVMYNTMDNYNLANEFDLKVETLYGPISNKDFEQYINDKYTNNRFVYVTAFSFDIISNIEALTKDSSLVIHIIIFQNLKINFWNNEKSFEFKAKKLRSSGSLLDREDVLLNIIDNEKLNQNREFLGCFPGSKFSVPLLLFANPTTK